MHFQSAVMDGLGNVEFKNPVLTETGRPRQRPDTERPWMSAHWIHLGYYTSDEETNRG